jgi:hypothetical protein
MIRGLILEYPSLGAIYVITSRSSTSYKDKMLNIVYISNEDSASSSAC